MFDSRLIAPSFRSGFARSAAESAAPELWPMHAWVPALGVQGNTLFDIAGGNHAVATGMLWRPDRIDCNDTSATMATAGRIVSYNWTHPWSVVVQASPDVATTDQTAIGIWDLADAAQNIWVVWYDVDGTADGWSFAFANTLSRYRLIGNNTASGGLGRLSTIIAGWTGTTWFLNVDGVNITESVTVNGDPGTPFASATTPVTIGGRKNGSTTAHFMDGQIKMAAIYPFAIPASAIPVLSADPLLPFRLRRRKVGRAPAGAGTDALTATDIATGAPTVGTPTIGQMHALTATDVATGAPTVGTPTLGQIHALTSTDVATGAPTVGTPTIGQVHALTSLDVLVGTPTIDAATLAQIHALVSQDVATGAPTVGTPTLSEPGAVVDLVAQDVLIGTPTIGTPTLGIAYINVLYLTGDVTRTIELTGNITRTIALQGEVTRTMELGAEI